MPFRPPTEKLRKEKALTAKKAQYKKQMIRIVDCRSHWKPSPALQLLDMISERNIRCRLKISYDVISH